MIVAGSLQEGYRDNAWFTANASVILKAGQKVHLLQTGTYKLGDGVTALSGLSFLGGSASTDIEESFTVSGSTVQLSQVPIYAYGYFLNGMKAKVGGRIVSISVTGLVTLDDDYTGSDFEANYKY